MNSEESCTWKDEKVCGECLNKGVLNCRWKASGLMLFYMLILPAMLGEIAGAVLIGISCGAWWVLIANVAFYPVVLGIAETRFLCSHCPFYAEEGRVLHCLANHGMLKIWRYHPEPMNRLEKGAMIALIIVFVMLMPGGILGYAIACAASYGTFALIAAISLAAVTALSLVVFGFVMIKKVCSACVNFSCPFNRVDERRVKAYLEKNPVMKKAWSDHGYYGSTPGGQT